ncbi:MAG TPA: DNA polymerase III subunit delta' [Nitrospinota bacterium]|jgi:DNA polymerase-3 subunit delta'|nr:DNA polymerase III subunit delta' [Nitrospinota bacterium]
MPFLEIIGQERPVRILQSSLKKGDVSHAYLFYGPEGIGKRLTALNFAKALNCLSLDDDSCGECIHCKKFDNKNFPDFLVIEPADGSIKIDIIRELQRKISYRPYEGKFKVIFIHGAEEMTLGAANSFLKTLEEPPGATVFILVCHNFNLLLPTIISRCQKIQFNLIPVKTIKDILIKENQITSEDAHLMASYSQGRLGKALEMGVRDTIEMRNEILDLIQGVSFDEMDLILKKNKAWSSDKENLEIILASILNIVRDMAVLKGAKNEKLIANLDVKDKLISLIRVSNINQLILLFHSVEETIRRFKRNINAQLLIDTLMIKMCSVFSER